VAITPFEDTPTSGWFPAVPSRTLLIACNRQSPPRTENCVPRLSCLNAGGRVCLFSVYSRGPLFPSQSYATTHNSAASTDARERVVPCPSTLWPALTSLASCRQRQRHTFCWVSARRALGSSERLLAGGLASFQPVQLPSGLPARRVS